MDYRSSTKVDKRQDQKISGTDPTKIEFDNIRWDLDGDYYKSRFYPPVSAIYLFGSVISLKNMVGVDSVNLSLYLNGEFYQTLHQGTEIFSNSAIVAGLQNGSDYFELYITLSGAAPLATIDASSNWTTFLYTELYRSEINS